MRRLLLLLVFCFSAGALFAQYTKDERKKLLNAAYLRMEQNSKKEPVMEIKPEKIVIEEEMDQTKWIIKSLDKYRKERLAASLVGIGGAGIIGASFVISDKPDTQVAVQAVGGAAVLLSYILSMNAERHLNKKNLTFTGSGLALRF